MFVHLWREEARFEAKTTRLYNAHVSVIGRSIMRFIFAPVTRNTTTSLPLPRRGLWCRDDLWAVGGDRAVY